MRESKALLENAIQCFRDSQDRIEDEIQKIESLTYIKDNGITKDDVWHTTAHFPPMHFRQSSYLWDYLVANPVKEKYVTWNGRLHLTREMASGTFKPTPARYEDLK